LFFITVVANFLFKHINCGYLPRQIFANINFNIVSLTVKRGLLYIITVATIFLFFITVFATFLFKPINCGYLRQIFSNIIFSIVSLTVKRGDYCRLLL